MASETTKRDGFTESEFEQGPSLLFAWRRKWTVLLITLLSLSLGYLYFLRQRPVYQSTAQILLVQRQAKLPIEGLDVKTGYEGKSGPDFTHESVISSPIVAKLAVEKADLTKLPTFAGAVDPSLLVIGGLDVKLGGVKRNKGDIIELKYSSYYPEDCPEVLEAVVEAYQSFLGSTYQNISEEAIKLIVQAKDELDRQLSETEAAYRKFRYEVPLLYSRESGQNMHELRLAQIEEVRSSAVLEHAQTQARIGAIENALQRGGSRAALKLMIAHINDGRTNEDGASPDGGLTEKDLLPALLEEQQLLETYGSDHPKVVTIRKRIALTKEYLVGTTAASNDDTKPGSFLETYLEAMREKRKLNEQTIAEMDALFSTEREASRSLATHQISDETYRAELDRKRRLFDAIIKRLEEINLVKDTGKIRIQLIHPPTAGVQIKPDFRKTMLGSGMLGLVVGLSLALVIDRADRRFRSSEDIREALGLPVIGHIPMLPAAKKQTNGDVASTDVSPALCTYHHPRGRDAEAYRAVRTALFFSTRGGGNQVIQITSPSPADGKTTLACNLAISIAQAGKSVLLLDADFRRPNCHRVLGIENTRGVVDVLNEQMELADAMQQTIHPHLHVLPCGPRPDNPCELLTSPQFASLISLLREKFEFVIVDTPPVLVVTDPLNVVPRVDGLLMVMRLNKSARNHCRRTIAMLEDHGANVLGLVVNGVQGGLEGYGAYKSNGYRYGYGGDGTYGYVERGHGYYEEGRSHAGHSRESANGDSKVHSASH